MTEREIAANDPLESSITLDRLTRGLQFLLAQPDYDAADRDFCDQLLVAMCDPPDSSYIPMVWCDNSSKVVVYPNALQLAVVRRALLVTLPMECDQVDKPYSLVIPIMLSEPDVQRGFAAMVEGQARGHPVLVDRWGLIAQRAIWSSLMTIIGVVIDMDGFDSSDADFTPLSLHVHPQQHQDPARLDIVFRFGPPATEPIDLTPDLPDIDLPGGGLGRIDRLLPPAIRIPGNPFSGRRRPR